MKIRERLALQFALAASAILSIAFFIIYFFEKQSLKNEFQNSLFARLKTYETMFFESGYDSSTVSALDRVRQTKFHQEKTVMLDASQKMLYNSNRAFNFPKYPQWIKSFERSNRISLLIGEYQVVGSRTPYRGSEYLIIVGATNLEHINQLRQLRFILVSTFALMLFLVFFSGWLLAKRALKPIQEVIAAVDRLDNNNLDKRLAVRKTPDEIGFLISILNKMLERIEQSVKTQKTFISSVSHELKNPLTKVISQVEVTLLKERDTETYKTTLKSVLDDAREMNHLSRSLLDLSNLEHDPKSFTFSAVRMDELIWEVRDVVESLPFNYQVDFSMSSVPELEDQLTLTGNPYLLKTAIQNVVENAAKYSFDQRVKVSLLCSLRKIEIVVSNQGPGIPAEEIPMLFELGFRGDQKSRISGYGIGLPLTKRILSIHRGQISVQSEPGATTTVIITFDKDPVVFF